LNKLEKDILDSEMGLYSRTEENVIDAPESDEAQSDLREVNPNEPVSEEYTEDGVQLKIDDMFFSGADDDTAIYNYHDELDLSSLETDPAENVESENPKEYDGSRLYHENG